MATQLDHPNIVPTFAVESGGPDVVVVTRGVGRYVTVQDLIVGGEGANRGQGGKLSLPVAAAIGKSVVEALAAAHKAGVVHGAVHPRSVLIDEDGQRSARRLRRRPRADHGGRAGRGLVAVARAHRLHRARARRRRGSDARRRTCSPSARCCSRCSRARCRRARCTSRPRSSGSSSARSIPTSRGATRTRRTCSRTCSRRSRTIAGSSPIAAS